MRNGRGLVNRLPNNLQMRVGGGWQSQSLCCYNSPPFEGNPPMKNNLSQAAIFLLLLFTLSLAGFAQEPVEPSAPGDPGV
jgi:hypothetical protein